MKKRSFKQQVEFVEKTILEEDKAWHDEFVKTHYPDQPNRPDGPGRKDPKKKRKKLLLSIGAIAAVAIIAVVSIVVSLPKDKKKEYFAENIASTPAALTEVNASLSGMRIDLIDTYETGIDRFYDKISNDVLYYKIQLNNDPYEKIILEFYVNKDFNDPNELGADVSNSSFKNYPLNYNLTSSSADGVYTLQYYAITKIGNIEIYINYRQLSDDEQGDFFEFLDRTIVLT